MTPEQVRERAREHFENNGWKAERNFLSCVANLILSIASEARQEERKRCEGIVRGAFNEGARSACDEILRRLGEK